MNVRTLGACVLLWSASAAAQQVSADEANKANNPLNPAPGVNFQDVWAPELYGFDSHTNDVLLRGTLPVRPGMLKWPQLIRVTVPISTRPTGSGFRTGLGDINIFDILLLGHTAGGIQYGAGPLLVMPTATDDALGTGKWQIGVATTAIHSSPRGLLGTLVQFQTSFAGDGDRPAVTSMTVQPLWIHNLQTGWYLRSSGIWTFNLRNGDFWTPVGFGFGKVMKSRQNTANFFFEPQWSVAHSGIAVPKYTIYTGINVTLGTGR